MENYGSKYVIAQNMSKEYYDQMEINRRIIKKLQKDYTGFITEIEGGDTVEIKARKFLDKLHLENAFILEEIQYADIPMLSIVAREMSKEIVEHYNKYGNFDNFKLY
tara:strand:- start:567 stop:887 length:321 start_codon:yes stop_codon:yes gene_type:complete